MGKKGDLRLDGKEHSYYLHSHLEVLYSLHKPLIELNSWNTCTSRFSMLTSHWPEDLVCNPSEVTLPKVGI